MTLSIVMVAILKLDGKLVLPEKAGWKDPATIRIVPAYSGSEGH
jgi:hypothetical protein